MNVYIHEYEEGGKMVEVLLSRRNVDQLIRAADSFDRQDKRPFLTRVCENLVHLIVETGLDFSDVEFNHMGNVVAARVPVQVLADAQDPSIDSEIWKQDGVFYKLTVENDDEHYERRELPPGPGIRGII